MKNTKYLACIAIFFSFFLFQCQQQKENKSIDNMGKQTNKVYINPNYSKKTIKPQQYKSTGKVYSIFIYNGTANSITANEKVTIKPNESYILKIPDTLGISLNNGIQFFFGATEGLEVIDNKVQVAGLDGEWLEKLNVPKSVDWAFSILNPSEGDPILE